MAVDGRGARSRATTDACRPDLKRLLLIVVAIAAAGCTAPGEPPAHPSQGGYGDLMRRETDKAASALATMQRVFAWVARDKITTNYATVTGHQSSADLAAIATDLQQVHAPTTQQQQAQAELRALAIREQALIDQTLNNLGDASAVTQANHQLKHAATREQTLATKVG